MKQILNDIKSSANCLSINKNHLDESRSDSNNNSIALNSSTESKSLSNKTEQTIHTNVTSCSNLFYVMEAKNFGAEKVRQVLFLLKNL